MRKEALDTPRENGFLSLCLVYLGFYCVLKTMTKRNLGRKGFVSSYTIYHWETTGQNLARLEPGGRMETETTEECSYWLASHYSLPSGVGTLMLSVKRMPWWRYPSKGTEDCLLHGLCCLLFWSSSTSLTFPKRGRGLTQSWCDLINWKGSSPFLRNRDGEWGWGWGEKGGATIGM